MVSVFTYGSLMIPEVMAAVTGKNFRSEEAVARGFSRHPLVGKPYPGIRPDASGSVTGRVYMEVDFDSLTLLNRFEDSLYEAKVVVVQVGQLEVSAVAYVVGPHYYDQLTEGEWDFNAFVANELPGYLVRCKGFYERNKNA